MVPSLERICKITTFDETDEDSGSRQSEEDKKADGVERMTTCKGIRNPKIPAL